MNRVAGIVRTHLTDKWTWIFLPWVILSISFICNVIIGGMSGDKIYTGGMASIYVYMFVLGIISIGQTFPFIIGFSVRRKDYFLGTAATITLISIASSFLLLLLGFIETQSDGWGVNLHFFHLPYLSDGPIFTRVWVLFSIMINVFFSGFAISCIHRKFGSNGLYLFFIVLSVVITFSSYLITMYGKWKAILDWFAEISVVQLANGLFVLTLIYVGISYLLLRKATV